MGKRICLLVLAVCVLLGLGGCRIIRIEEEERKPLEYTIVNQQEIPEEILSLIEEKKAGEFQMTYQSGEEMYLIKGYGRQMSGGYSIRVEELSHSSNGIFFMTHLIGPKDDSMAGEPSYPYLVVKMAYREEPVVFE